MRPETEALAGFLSAIDFTHFCTFTTRRPVSINATRHIAEKVAKFIRAGSESTMFWAAEKFDTREGFHFHALMQAPKASGDRLINSIEIFNWYYPRYGRCQIINNTDPETRQSAAFYCAKYITKSLADYDIYFANDIRQRETINLYKMIDPFQKFPN